MADLAWLLPIPRPAGYDTLFQSSPVRGTLVPPFVCYLAGRFIPARAGNSGSWGGRSGGQTVHPRPCGEQTLTPPRRTAPCGSSPPVRGTGRVILRSAKVFRFIPARAGNSRGNPDHGSFPPVHPRPCGEQRCLNIWWWMVGGSSPPVRGTELIAILYRPSWRFIPARAGNSRCRCWLFGLDAVHPRPCGEQNPLSSPTTRCCGSSPPVRGTAKSAGKTHVIHRFIPARAGNRLNMA